MHVPLDMLASTIATRMPAAMPGHFQNIIPLLGETSENDLAIGALLV